MNSNIDSVLTEVVFDPWRKASENSDRPWRATPKLRREWHSMVLSADQDVSLAGAIALARVSLHEEHEFAVVENYFNNLDEVSIEPDTLAMVLLTGASPPHLFIQSFLTLRLLDQDGWNDSFYWSLFSSYIRHPHAAGLPYGKMFKDGKSGKIHYILKCNPLAPVDNDAPKGNWHSALRQFRGLKNDGFLCGKTEIAGIARILRADWSPQDLNKAIDKLCLDSVIEDQLFEHPVLTARESLGSIVHADPSSKVIDFFSGENCVSKIWRFYNPLLIPPWMMEKLDDKQTPLLYLGKLLCGMIPSPSYSGADKTVVNRISAGHPFLVLDFDPS